MTEFLNYVPVEGSIGELLIMKVLPVSLFFIALILTTWIICWKLKKFIED